MTSIAGEYGYFIRVSAQEDISNNTNTLILRSPAPYVTEKVITAADGLFVGATTLIIEGVTFTAGEYVQYEVQEGDVSFGSDEPWLWCLESLTPAGELKKLGPFEQLVASC